MPGYRDIYMIRSPLSFAGLERRGKAVYSVVGVPFDSTASYRPGQRFAPTAIREASINIEGNGYAIEGFIDDVHLSDEGDVVVSHGNIHETLSRVTKVVAEIAGEGVIPVLLGGEHTVTLGALRGLAEAGVKPCIVSLDAHFDLRDEYLGERFSHASWLRRALEELGVKAVIVGVRAYDKEEVEYAEASGLAGYIPAWTVQSLGLKATILRVTSELAGCDKIYLTIDMDFYDPAYAPGVGNPEPGGLSVHEGLTLIAKIAGSLQVAGIDIVEVAPPHDPAGVTSVLAAKTLQQAVIASWVKGQAKPG